MTQNNNAFMKEAIHRAWEGMTQAKGGPFGAIIVKEGKIIGKGENRVTSTNDPTAHAEMVAIRDACKNSNSFSLEGAHLFTSCEPCPMCLAAIYWARIEKIFYACSREDAKNIGFDDAYIYEQVSLPLDKRAIPLVQILHEEGLVPFKAWQAKIDKIPY